MRALKITVFDYGEGEMAVSLDVADKRRSSHNPEWRFAGGKDITGLDDLQVTVEDVLVDFVSGRIKPAPLRKRRTR